MSGQPPERPAMLPVDPRLVPYLHVVRWCFGCAGWTWAGQGCIGCGGHPAVLAQP